MRSTRKRLVIATAVVAVAATGITTAAVQGSGRGAADGGIPAGAATFTGGLPSKASKVTGTLSKCKTGKAEVVASNDTNLSTTSSTFVPLMSTTFKTAKGCVIVNVSGYSFATGGELLDLTASLDGSTGLPSYTQFSGDDDENANSEWARAHSAQFMFLADHGGTHTVTVWWLSLFGGTVFMHQPSMTVFHG